MKLRKLLGSEDAIDRVDAIAELRRVVLLNAEDRSWAKSIPGRTARDEASLEKAYAELSTNPTDKTVDTILDLTEQIKSQRGLLIELFRPAIKGVNARCTERTKKALAPALEVIRQKLMAELADSQARDERFKESTIHRRGGVLNSGLKSEADMEAESVSGATEALQQAIKNCESYIERLPELPFEKLRGPIEFCLSK